MSLARAGQLALALVVAGCAESNSATVVELPPPPQSDAPKPIATAPPTQARSAAPALAGDWRGSYECAQGETDLDLHVSVMGSEVVAVFRFSHEGSGARGAYELRGELAASGDVSLVPSRWIEQPSGYIMVGMRGTVSGDVFRGRITHASCRGFEVQRVR